MSSATPPTEYFPGINFNPSFYNLGSSAVSLEYLNSNFLRSTGYAISRAQFTLFNGTVDINENLDVSGNINASAYLLNGFPVSFSQWTTSGNDIYYNSGNIGIGKTNPSYNLDVSGNINCNSIYTNGTELTQYTDQKVEIYLTANNYAKISDISNNNINEQDVKNIFKNGNYNENVKINRALEIEPATAGKQGFYFYNGIMSLSTQPRIYIDANTDIILCDNFITRDGRNEDTRIKDKIISLLGFNLFYNVDTQKIDSVPSDVSIDYYNKTYINNNFYTINSMGLLYYNQSYINNNYYTQAQINSITSGYDTAIQTISDNVSSLTPGNNNFDVIGYFENTANTVSNTISGIINRRSLATPTENTIIDNTGSATTSSYIIFENAIQVQEIIFTDDPTFKFKNKTELRDAIITLDPFSLEYDANGRLSVTENVRYTDNKVINLIAGAFGDYLEFDEEYWFGKVNILQVSQAIDYTNIPGLVDAINSGSGSGTTIPTGLITIGEDPDNPNTGLIDMKFGTIKTYKMNIDDRLDFVKTIVQNGQTYFLAGGYIENVITPEGIFTNMFGHSAVFDNALIKSLTVNNFQVKGTIGQLDSAIPTKVATPAQTVKRRTYNTSLDTEEAVYSTYYNKYTNDIEVYGIIFQDDTYISSAQDIKDAIDLNNYALQSSLNTTNGNISANTASISGLDSRVSTIENTYVTKNNHIISLGNYTTSFIPEVRLLGGNGSTMSSRFTFADGTAPYAFAMAISYDSNNNIINFNGDNDGNASFDTPNMMSIRRSGNVGVGVNFPSYKLDVNGDINTTGKFKVNGVNFNDAEYIKSLLETAGYIIKRNVMYSSSFIFQTINTTTNNTWFKINIFNSTETVFFNHGNFIVDHTNNWITIPVTGIYRLSYKMNYTSISTDRINISNVWYKNGAELLTTEARSGYARFSGWLAGANSSSLVSLTAGDYLELYVRVHRSATSANFQINGGASSLDLELVK